MDVFQNDQWVSVACLCSRYPPLTCGSIKYQSQGTAPVAPRIRKAVAAGPRKGVAAAFVLVQSGFRAGDLAAKDGDLDGANHSRKYC